MPLSYMTLGIQTKAMFGLRVLRPRLGAKRISAFFLLSAVKADHFQP